MLCYGVCVSIIHDSQSALKLGMIQDSNNCNVITESASVTT